MSKRAIVASGGVGAVAGFCFGKLSSADFKALLDKIIDGSFEFLRQQGAYASFAIVLTAGFGWLSVWCIRQLVDGKQKEIDRIAADRDKFQQLFIDEWRSTKVVKVEEKGARKKQP
jgi:hypothetical protein